MYDTDFNYQGTQARGLELRVALISASNECNEIEISWNAVKRTLVDVHSRQLRLMEKGVKINDQTAGGKALRALLGRGTFLEDREKLLEEQYLNSIILQEEITNKMK